MPSAIRHDALEAHRGVFLEVVTTYPDSVKFAENSSGEHDTLSNKPALAQCSKGNQTY